MASHHWPPPLLDLGTAPRFTRIRDEGCNWQPIIQCKGGILQWCGGHAYAATQFCIRLASFVLRYLDLSVYILDFFPSSTYLPRCFRFFTLWTRLRIAHPQIAITSKVRYSILVGHPNSYRSMISTRLNHRTFTVSISAYLQHSWFKSSRSSLSKSSIECRQSNASASRSLSPESGLTHTRW